MEEFQNNPEFIDLKFDFVNAFNAVSRSIFLNECFDKFPIFLNGCTFAIPIIVTFSLGIT